MCILSDEEDADGRKDFNNSVIYFTIPAGDEEYDIPTDDIIIDDDINEAQESLILVLEIGSVNSADMVQLDEQFQGILLFTINDDDGVFMYILFSVCAHVYLTLPSLLPQ